MRVQAAVNPFDDFEGWAIRAWTPEVSDAIEFKEWCEEHSLTWWSELWGGIGYQIRLQITDVKKMIELKLRWDVQENSFMEAI